MGRGDPACKEHYGAETRGACVHLECKRSNELGIDKLGRNGEEKVLFKLFFFLFKPLSGFIER